MELVVNIWSFIDQILCWRQPCACCGAPGRALLCPGCQADLPRLDNPCRRCAEPLPAGATPLCPRCLGPRPPAFARIHALFAYAPPVDRLITGLKYHGRWEAARLLGSLLGEALAGADPVPDILVPVPLHPRRLRRRGYNQALEMARHAAARARLPLEAGRCRRVRHGPPQAGQDAAARRRAVRDAFAVDGRVDGLHVGIIDDVVTTAATVNELARVLRRAGAREVSVWCAARAGRTSGTRAPARGRSLKAQKDP